MAYQAVVGLIRKKSRPFKPCKMRMGSGGKGSHPVCPFPLEFERLQPENAHQEVPDTGLEDRRKNPHEGRRRHCAPAHFLLVAVVVQVAEGPLCLSLATPESVYEGIVSDRLLWCEPLYVLDYFSVVVPLIGVAVRFLETLLFEKLDELGFGVRRDDNLEVRREACVEC